MHKKCELNSGGSGGRSPQTLVWRNI